MSMEALLGCEANMQTGFAQMAEAFRQVMDDELYRAANYDSYEEYCHLRMGVKKSYGYAMAAAARVNASLTEAGFADVWLPSNEAQCRPFAKLDPKSIPGAAQAVVEDAPIVNGEPKISAKSIENTLINRRFMMPQRSKQTTQQKQDEQNLRDFLSAIEQIVLTPWDGAFAVERFGLARFRKLDVKHALDKLNSLYEAL